MRIPLKTAILTLGIAFAGSTAQAASTADINAGLIAATPGSWYFNFTAQSTSDHHVPRDALDALIPRDSRDYTVDSPGSLNYSDPVRTNTTTVDVGLRVTGFSGFDADNNLLAPQEKIRHDYVGTTNTQNGIGVMSENSNSTEQVNHVPGEYLRLEFSNTIEIRGFDFASGEHKDCDTDTNCGGFELFSFDGTNAVSLTSGSLNSDDFVAFNSGFIGTDFLIRATGPTNNTNGEIGWYLSAIAGDRVAVPEPGSLALFGAGLLGLGLARRRLQSR